jgi:hypothetical protein
MTFRGRTPLTVAAKAAQLKFDEHGFWVNERLATGPSVVEIRGLGAEPARYLDDPELVLD